MKTRNLKSWDLKRLFAAVLVAFFIAVPGCAGNYGKISKDAEINESFLRGEILPDYDYYYTGPEGVPSAILRIRKDYGLAGDLWRPFDPSEATLRRWVENLDFQYKNRVRYYPYGYRVVYCDGDVIGGWYSIWDWTAVECLEGKKVNVYPPPLGDPYRDGDVDDDRDRKD